MDRKVLRGRVAGGVGDLSRWMTRYADAYERATGVRLHPGSLNVVLDKPWTVHRAPLRLEADDVGVGMSIVPCQIGHLPAFIMRTDRNNAGLGDHQPNVIEIAAAVNLRRALDLADGDTVEITVTDACPP